MKKKEKQRSPEFEGAGVRGEREVETELQAVTEIPRRNAESSSRRRRKRERFRPRAGRKALGNAQERQERVSQRKPRS